MVFREWIKTEPEAPPMTEDRRKSLEKVAWATLSKVRDEIIRGGKWRSSPEVIAAEEQVRETYQAAVAGKGSLQAFSAACEKWKQAGTAAQTERNISPMGEKDLIPERQLRPHREKEGEPHGSA